MTVFENLSIWWFLIPLPMWLCGLIPPQDYYLTAGFIQKGDFKLLYSDLRMVRSFFHWYIIVDQYGDTIWVPHPFLTPSSQACLEKWLGIDRFDTNIGAQGNS